MTYNAMHERIKHGYIMELIGKCVLAESVVINKYVLPYLWQQETVIASKIGRQTIKEEK